MGRKIPETTADHVSPAWVAMNMIPVCRHHNQGDPVNPEQHFTGNHIENYMD